MAATPFRAPQGVALAAIVERHFAASVAFYGERIGLRVFRKHLAAYIEAAPWLATGEAPRAARARLCRLEGLAEIGAAIREMWSEPPLRQAA